MISFIMVVHSSYIGNTNYPDLTKREMHMAKVLSNNDYNLIYHYNNQILKAVSGIAVQQDNIEYAGLWYDNVYEDVQNVIACFFGN